MNEETARLLVMVYASGRHDGAFTRNGDWTEEEALAGINRAIEAVKTIDTLEAAS